MAAQQLNVVNVPQREKMLSSRCLRREDSDYSRKSRKRNQVHGPAACREANDESLSLWYCGSLKAPYCEGETMARKTNPLPLAASVATLALVTGFCSFLNAERPAGDRAIRAFASILPQAYFVQRVGGDRVEVDVLVQPGQSPSTYSPTAKQMAKLTKSQVLFCIGVPFEKALLGKIGDTMKELLIVDTAASLRTLEGESHDDEEEDDGDGHEHHHHGETDPHTWLSPPLVQQQAKVICDAMVRLDPEGKAVYETNLKAFTNDLEDLHQRITKALAPVKGRELFVFHPAYGYFANTYGLRQVAVETGGKEPSARQLVQLIRKARKQGAKVLFVQPQFSRKSAETIAKSIRGAVVPLDPLARDYIGNLEEMARKVVEALD